MPAPPSDRVAIVGASGALGFALAIRLARGGVHVAIGSRAEPRARQTVQRALVAVPSGSFSAHGNGAAAGGAEIVILSVPFASQPQTLVELAPVLRPGQLVIDATVPLAVAVGGGATRMLGLWQGSAAEQARELLPDGVGVVSAMHTVSAGSLADLEHPLEQDVLMCGDDLREKRRAAALIERIEGLRCVDCGPLELARVTEAITALMIDVKVRYSTHGGIRLTGLEPALWRCEAQRRRSASASNL